MKPALKELLLIHVEVMDKGKLGLYPERHSTKDAYRRATEILQYTRVCKANCRLKAHNAHLQLASPMLG